MPWWKCDKCGYSFQAEMPPKDSKCPSCGNKCSFKDATCYIPECGHDGEHEHIDPRI